MLMRWHSVLHLLLLYHGYISSSIVIENDNNQSHVVLGHLLFLIREGEHEQALNVYLQSYQTTKQHDFEALHQIGLSLLDYGFKQNDPECQLLTLFGAGIAAHDDSSYIMEEGIKSRFPEIQILALRSLASLQSDRADRILLHMLGSPHLAVRYEVVHQLCKKQHTQAIAQTESLMYKTPRELRFVYPSLFAMIETPQANRILHKLLNSTSNDLRLATLLSIAKYKRDDMLPQIRLQLSQHHFAHQEACIYTLGVLKDDASIDKIKRLTTSQYANISLAAYTALYRLGKMEAITAIENSAENGNIFAIVILGEIAECSPTLLELLTHPNLQVRVNACIALLRQKNAEALKQVQEILIRDKRDLGFTLQYSPGKTFKAWQSTVSASELFKNDDKAYAEHLELRESLLREVSQLSEDAFISLAHHIFNQQQNDLVRSTVGLLEELGSAKAIACLKQHQQQLGAPFVRHYCTLSLYRLNEKGPYKAQLCAWVKNQYQAQLIHFKPIDPWVCDMVPYNLTPVETSRLLVDAFEALAMHQDSDGIETLIEAIAKGHSKNKYALAGLLLRATQ